MVGTVISFLNMKGGVGKTALCKEIGYALAKNEKKVLFVDIDPQSNLTQSIFTKCNYMTDDLYKNLPEAEKNRDSRKRKNKIKRTSKSIGKLFGNNPTRPTLDDVILKMDDFDIIPGELSTIFLERALGGAAQENALDNFFLENAITNQYDYVFIDCPPTYSFYTTAALNASDYYVVPVGLDAYSVLGISLLEEVVKKIKETDKRKFQSKTLENLGVIFNPFNFFSEEENSNIINSIKSNDSLSNFNFYFFNEKFEYNPTLKKKPNYFILDNLHKKSISNLNTLVSEFEYRVHQMKGEEK